MPCCLFVDELLADLHSATTTSTIPAERVPDGTIVSVNQTSEGRTTYRDSRNSNDGDHYHTSSFPPHTVYIADHKVMSEQPLQLHHLSGNSLGLNSSHSKRDSDRYSVDSGASGDGLPPPLPPHPSQDIIDEASSAHTHEVCCIVLLYYVCIYISYVLVLAVTCAPTVILENAQQSR